jgi:hypothetical protein
MGLIIPMLNGYVEQYYKAVKVLVVVLFQAA